MHRKGCVRLARMMVVRPRAASGKNLPENIEMTTASGIGIVTGTETVATRTSATGILIVTVTVIVIGNETGTEAKTMNGVAVADITIVGMMTMMVRSAPR